MSSVDGSSVVDVSASGSIVVVYMCTLSFSVCCGNVISGTDSVVALFVVAIMPTRFTVVGRSSGTKSILSDFLVWTTGASVLVM